MNTRKTPKELEIDVTAGELQRYLQQVLRAKLDLILSNNLLTEELKNSKEERDVLLVKELQANIEAATRDIEEHQKKVDILNDIYLKL